MSNRVEKFEKELSELPEYEIYSEKLPSNTIRSVCSYIKKYPDLVYRIPNIIKKYSRKLVFKYENNPDILEEIIDICRDSIYLVDVVHTYDNNITRKYDYHSTNY